MFRQERIPDGALHIKACQPDGMYLTARATWYKATDSLTTAKYEHVLGRNGYCSAYQ